MQVLFLLVLGLSPQDKAGVPSEAACVEFARKVESTLNAADPGFLNSRADVNVVLDRALKDLPHPEARKKAFREGVLLGGGWGSRMVQAVENGGRFKFLRLRTIDGQRRVLFRMLIDFRFSYQDYLLTESAGGEIRITDFFQYQTGEWTSETLRRAFRSSMADPVALFKLGSLGPEGQKELMGKLRRFQLLALQNKPREALEIWKSFPEIIRKEKVFLISRCNLANQLGGEAALKALEDFRKAYPDDSAVDILSIAPLVENDKFAEALAAIERLDARLGGDPYLHCERATVRLREGKIAEAKTILRKAIKEESDLQEPYWLLMNFALEEKDFAETARLLTALERDAGVELADLEDLDDYKEFVASPEYRAWKEARRKK